LLASFVHTSSFLLRCLLSASSGPGGRQARWKRLSRPGTRSLIAALTQQELLPSKRCYAQQSTTIVHFTAARERNAIHRAVADLPVAPVTKDETGDARDGNTRDQHRTSGFTSRHAHTSSSTAARTLSASPAAGCRSASLKAIEVVHRPGAAHLFEHVRTAWSVMRWIRPLR